MRAQLRFRDGLQRLSDAGIRSFVAHGNHDPVEEGWSAIDRFAELVTVFGAGEVRSVPFSVGGEPVTVHGNIDSENFLWQGTEIASVQGFGEAHVGDPATDLVNLLDLDENILDALIESYQNTRSKHLDEHCLTRAYLINELNIVRWLQHGIRTGNADIKRDALDMLSELAESVDADPTLASGPAWDVDPSGR